MTASDPNAAPRPSLALEALALIAAYYRIAADPAQIARDLAISLASAGAETIVAAAKTLGLRARIIENISPERLATLPLPAIVELRNGQFAPITAGSTDGKFRVLDLATGKPAEAPIAAVAAATTGRAILITRRFGGPGQNPPTFGFSWFIPSLKRYRGPLAHVLVASLAIQALGLLTPLFFQLVVDKVLVHKTFSTLVVLIVGLAAVGIFEVVLQYLRAYTLNHTTNRIDVELGRRLFHHLFRLPIAYFESRPAGQTVARIRELETIRSFLTGQGLTSVLDLVFTLIFLGVLFLYSAKLTLIVIASIPVYVAIALAFRPALKAQLDEKFNRGALSQQFLVESIIGAQTLKAAGVEPTIQLQWEERLAAYVKTGFDVSMLAAFGQNLIQYTSKAITALTLFIGAQAVIDGQMTVGELIAFNMISGQVVQPILRLSQLWQDFQQVQTSVNRLGDILNAQPEATQQAITSSRPLAGAIQLRDVTFAYPGVQRPALAKIDLSITAGEHIGIVGPSGSGKSTLTKLHNSEPS